MLGSWVSSFASLILMCCYVGITYGQINTLPLNASAYLRAAGLDKPDDRSYVLFGFNNQPGSTLGLQGIFTSQGFMEDDSASYHRWHALVWRQDGLAFPRNQPLELFFGTNESPDAPSVRVPVELEQGQFSQHVSFLVPSYPTLDYHVGGTWCQAAIRADGRLLPGLGIRQILGTKVYTPAGRVAPSRSLFVASPMVLVANFKRELSTADQLAIGQGTIKKIVDKRLATTAWLPSDWRELAGFYPIVIDADAFPDLTTDQKQALGNYVMSGGELWFAQCASDTKLYDDMLAWTQRFAMPDVSQLSDSLSEQRLALNVAETNSEDPSANTAGGAAVTGTIRNFNPLKPIATIASGFGGIALLRQDLAGLSQQRAANRSIFYEATRTERLFDVHKMNWTIEKLGRPPVWFFLATIGLFSLLAGPGLVWWLNHKIRRPIWLLAIFPTVALTISLSIFLYAIFHDGFATHSRLRSITCVNAESGLGFAYSRQTYFSGFPPVDAVFGPSSEQWVIKSDQERLGFEAWKHQPKNIFDQSSDQQRLSNPLSPRLQQQWISNRPLADYRPIELREGSGDDQPRLRNQLNESLALAVITDSQGKLWMAKEIAPSATVELKQLELDEAKSLLLEQLPVDLFPVGYSDQAEYSTWDWLSSRRRFRTRVRPNTAGNNSKSMAFEALPQRFLSSGFDKPRHFLLILDRAEHIDRPFGLRVSESDSSHIVAGIW
jgi:hypothetical protein